MSYHPEIGRFLETDPIGDIGVGALGPSSTGLTVGNDTLSAANRDVAVQAQVQAASKAARLFNDDHALDWWLWEYMAGANVYQYLGGNPLNGTDPSGLDRYVVDGGMGHHGIAVDQWTVVNGKYVKTGVVTYDFSANYWLGPLLAGQLTGIPAAGMVRRTPGINGTIQSTLPACPQADMTLTGNMEAAVINPPLYSLYWYNCNWFVQYHLLDGIK